MKIVHVFKDAYPPLAAGITGYLADIADGTAGRGHEVELHVAGVHRSRRDVLASGVVVHRHAELGRAMSSPLSPGLVREVRSLDADVLHLHMPNPLGELGAALRKDSTPIIVTFHAQLGRQRVLEPVYGPLRNAIVDRAAAILVSSERMAETPELERAREHVHVLPYGVSPRLTAHEPSATREPASDLRLLFVGRLVYYKGIDILLAAIAEVPGVVLTVVGEGALRDELERTIRELGLGDRVQLAGAVTDDELIELYATHDVFVMASVSRAEAFGLAMSEAMANGLPAISTRLGTGTDWVNLDDVTGLVVEPGDVTALRDAIERLRDPVLRERLGAGAQARTEALFGFEHHLDRLLEIYETAVRS